MRTPTLWFPSRSDKKTVFAVTEDGLRLEILDLERRENVIMAAPVAEWLRALIFHYCT